MTTRTAILATAAAFTLAAGAASAQTTLKWAHVYETSEPYHPCAVAASDKLMQATDGRYNIEVFPASSLGKEVDINEGLGLGTVDIIYTGMNFAGRSFEPMTMPSSKVSHRMIFRACVFVLSSESIPACSLISLLVIAFSIPLWSLIISRTASIVSSSAGFLMSSYTS